MKKYKIIFLLFLITTQLFGINTYTVDQIEKDYKAGDMSKYQKDNLPLLDFQALKTKGIYSTIDEMKPAIMDAATCESKMTNLVDFEIFEVLKCPTNAAGGVYTTSLFNTNLSSGTYQCVVAEVGEKYRPFGKFELELPKGCKEFLKKDKVEAELDMNTQISNSKNIYKELYDEKRTIKSSIDNYAGSNYLNISDILLSAILSDSDILDIQSSKSTNKVQLHSEYNSQVTQPDLYHMSSIDNTAIYKTNSNTDFISSNAATIADVFSKLSDLSMVYLFMLVIFFGIWGVGKLAAGGIVNKIENKNDNDTKIPYIATILIGLTLFFPVSREEITTGTGVETEKYESMQSNFMKFERTGYYLFMGWATDATEVIVDSEMDSLISRAGLSNVNDIIHNYASKVQSSKFYNVHRNITNSCNVIFDYNSVNELNGGTRYYPTTEINFYANNILNGNGATYYDLISNPDTRGVINQYKDTTNTGERYPSILLSACGKSYNKITTFQTKYNDYDAALSKSSAELETLDEGKIDIIKNLIKFQYELNRDFGLLGILGLPVTIMQTEHIGSLISKDNELKDELKSKNIVDDSLNSMLSSIPFLLVPGAETFYRVATSHATLLGGISGGKLGYEVVPEQGWFGKLVTTVEGAVIGAGTGFIFPEVVGLAFGYQAALIMLAMAPILGIFLIGIGRFIIIYAKIFTFHFMSIFILPILFARKNIAAISKFSIKILSTMIELPLFVLSIWLAMTAHKLLTNVGEEMGQRIIAGMLSNLQTSNMGVWETAQIYIFDGLVQVGVALFSLVLIYKIIITTHSSVLELFEMNAANSLDSAMDSMMNENKSLKL